MKVINIKEAGVSTRVIPQEGVNLKFYYIVCNTVSCYIYEMKSGLSSLISGPLKVKICFLFIRCGLSKPFRTT